MMRNGLCGMKQRGRCLWTTSSSSSNKRSTTFLTRSVPVSDEFAVLGLTPLASKSDVKHAYKTLALKYHPDVIKEENMHGKQEMFKDIKSAYESLMEKFDLEEMAEAEECEDYDEWDEWMGFEGGMPVIYTAS